MPLSPDGTIGSSLIGTHLAPDTLEVTSELIERYALAVNDDNPRYLNRGSTDVIAPPVFAIVPLMRLLRTAMVTGTLPLSVNRTVHGEHEMVFVSPIRPGDILVSSAQVRDVKEHSSGTTIEIENEVNSRNGATRSIQVLTAFVRKTNNSGGPPKPRDPERTPLHVSITKVTSDQSIRYANASFTEGIKPHEDHETARSLGYKTMFLQGQCTMAFAMKAIVDNIADRDPTRLRSIKVRFSQVVYPSEILTTRIWRSGEYDQYMFDTIKDDGTLALANGVAVVD